METNETVALGREVADLAERDEIAQPKARRLAHESGVSFHALLKLGALLLLLVKMARAIVSGEPVSQAFTLFGIRWRLTIQREVV